MQAVSVNASSFPIHSLWYNQDMKHKRTRLRMDRVLLLAGSVLLLLFLAVMAVRAVFFSDTGPRPTAAGQGSDSSRNQTGKTQRVSVTATGDILLEEPLLNTFGSGSWQDCLADIDPLLAADDLTIANMEVPIGGEELGITGIDYSFNAPARTAQNLKDHSIEFVSLANNHAADRGTQGILNTHRNLDEAGIGHTGTFGSQEERNQTNVVTVNGMDIAIVSWTYDTNQPYDQEWQVNSFYSPDSAQSQVLLEDIRQARSQADAVIVCMHWGTEFTYGLNEAQTLLGPQIAQAGADVIIGNHPHTIQPAEWIETDGRKTLCLWSLGNFLSSAYQVDRADETFQDMYEVGALAAFDLVPGASGVRVENTRIIPIVNHFEGEYESFGLMKLKDYTEELAAAHSQRRFSDLFTKDWLVQQVHEVFDPSGIELELD